jgi:hypothetical protein
MSEVWIIIPGWAKFQHYPSNRGIAWVKDYLDQLDRDEYMALTFAQRGLLKDLRKLYARRRGVLSGDTASLSRALSERVLSTQLEALNHAGYIEFSASKPLAHFDNPASTEEEVLRTSSKKGGARAKATRARTAPEKNSAPDRDAALAEAFDIAAGWDGPQDTLAFEDALDQVARRHHTKIPALDRDRLWDIAFGNHQ